MWDSALCFYVVRLGPAEKVRASAEWNTMLIYKTRTLLEEW